MDNLNAYDIDEDMLDREMAHEQSMLEEGVNRYLKAAQKDRERGNQSRTGGGKAVLAGLTMPLSHMITEEIARLEDGAVRKKPPELRSLKLLPPRDAAVLALTSVLDRVAMDKGARCSTQAVGFAVGNAVATEWMAREFNSQDKGMLKAVVKRIASRNGSPAQRQKEIVNVFKSLDEKNIDPLTTTEKVRLGAFLLTAMEHLGLVESVTVYKGKKATKEYQLSDQVVETIRNAEQVLAEMKPYFMPTVVPPRPWVNLKSGGYWMPFRGNGMVIARNRSNGIKSALDEDMPGMFTPVNYMQCTPYRVNSKVLAVVEQMRRSNMDCASLPPAQLEAIPTKPHDIDTNEEARMVWRKAAREAHTRNAASKGRILAAEKCISVAKSLEDEPKIYFPKAVDFRGRVYDLPMFLKPQGDDLSKGLLEFGNGKPLGDMGGYWLAIHGANVFGEDKVSLDDRVAWVMANEDRILRAAAEPFAERFWMDADKPFQFLAFCFEWQGARELGDEYVSHLAVALDGSCNGLQHLSALLRDPVGGAAVNLLPSSKPQDIYTEVMTKAIAILEQRVAQGEPTASKWLPLMKRKTVKRPVMTLPYGATRTGFADQIMEDTLRPLQRAGECPFAEPYRASQYLGEIVWEATGQVVVAAREAMDWLQSVAKVVAKSGHCIQWTTPTGFVVKQDYKKLKSRKVELTALGSRVTVRVADGHQDKIDSRKMALAIAPNFVHAMDAAHMLRTVRTLLDVVGPDVHLSMIHDSYGTHACDAEALSQTIRQSFVQMYQEKCWLTAFRDEVASQLPEEIAEDLPPVPLAGTLNLAEVQKSLYFFA